MQVSNTVYGTVIEISKETFVKENMDNCNIKKRSFAKKCKERKSNMGERRLVRSSTKDKGTQADLGS